MSGWNIPALFSVRAVCENSMPNRYFANLQKCQILQTIFPFLCRKVLIIAGFIVKSDRCSDPAPHGASESPVNMLAYLHLCRYLAVVDVSSPFQAGTNASNITVVAQIVLS